MKKRKFDWRENLDLIVVFVFLVIRLFLNMDFILDFSVLSLFFAVIYLFFIFMLVKRIHFFSVAFVLFLTVDSMIGTYLFASGILENLEFYLTMLINFAIISIVIRNQNRIFPK